MLLSYFVPDPSSGTFRSLALANHLVQNGWVVDVVTVSESDIPRQEPELYEELGPLVRIIRCPKVDAVGWVRNRLSRFRPGPSPSKNNPNSAGESKKAQSDYFQLSSRAMRWTWPLYLPDKSLQWALSVAIQSPVRKLARSADVLYSSSPQHSVHIAAALLKKTTGSPWVADFRDPWADNPLRVLPPNPLAPVYDRVLEKLVVGAADWIVCNTPPMEAAYKERFDGRVPGISTVLNGFDASIFSEDGCLQEIHGDKLTVVHVGSLYGQRDITPLLEALAGLKREQPAIANDFSFHFVGPNTESYRASIDSLDLNNIVTLSGPVPLDEALAWDRRAHVCLCLGLTGTENQSQIPAKLYQFIALGKPVLSLAKRGSAIESVVKRSGLQYFFGDPDDLSSVSAALQEIHNTWLRKALRFGGNVTLRKRFDRVNTARAIEDIFHRVLNTVS